MERVRLMESVRDVFGESQFEYAGGHWEYRLSVP